MFKVIEVTTPGYIRLPSIDNEKIETGKIVQLVNQNDDVYCKLSDGHKPFGIAIGRYKQFIKIMSQKMVFRTDCFEVNAKYTHGSLLYVSINGLLTSEKYDESCQLVGSVNIDNRSEKGYIEVNWI